MFMALYPTLTNPAARLVAIMFLFGIAPWCAGAAILYDEAVSGDLPVAGAPLPTFTFDAGSNVVRGTTGINPTDLDSFAFIVPADMQVVSGGVVLTDRAGDVGFVKWILNTGSANFSAGTPVQNFSAPSPGSAILASVLSAGTYNVSASDLSGLLAGSNSADYIFNFDVQPTGPPTPEPSASNLLALGAAVVVYRSILPRLLFMRGDPR